MFIRNDAPDTPGNRRWRFGERAAQVLLGVCLCIKMIYDGAVLSNFLAESQYLDLKTTFWSTTRKADLADGQLRSFRGNLPLLTVAAVCFICLRHAWQSKGSQTDSKLHFYLLTGLGFGWYLHGPGVIFLLLWACFNYCVGELCRGMKFYAVGVWIGNLGFLVLTEYAGGYKFAWLWSGVSWLDALPKEMPWHRSTNMCFLKLLSFLLDHHWATLQLPTPTKEKCEECTLQINCIRFRQDTHADNYSLLAFIAYFFYPPLFLAGPTLSYNAWISQVESPQQTFNTRRKLTYLARLLFALILLELCIHFLYFPTIANSQRHKALWNNLSAYDMAIVSYLILNWIWLKFLVIWRFFRLWAICDGIEAVENMGKCMTNNFSFEDFWRMWHRAFNQWLIRYLFVPLGGSRLKIYNIWVVFGFVAIWHDLSLHLLVWGWGICIILVPEVLSKAFMAQAKYAEFRKTIGYNWLCSCAGATCGICMILLNMVGFSYGVDGFSAMVAKLVEPSGLLVLLKCWVVAVIEVHLLLGLRRDEDKGRKDIKSEKAVA